MKMFALAVALIALSVPAHAESPDPVSSPLQIQQIQTREFEAGIDILFPAIIHVLQDGGYTITTSDRAGGLITGQAASKSTMTYNIFWGFGSKKRSQSATFFVEPRGEGRSRVRLNIVNGLAKRTLYGTRREDDEQVLDPEVYRQVFEKLDQAVFLRIATDTPQSSITPSASTAPNTLKSTLVAPPLPAVVPVPVSASQTGDSAPK